MTKTKSSWKTKFYRQFEHKVCVGDDDTWRDILTFIEDEIQKAVVRERSFLAMKMKAVTYKEDGGHGWAVPMAEITGKPKQS